MWDLQDKSKIDLGQQLPKIRLMCMIIAITQNAHYTNDLEPNYLQSKDNFKAPQSDFSMQLVYRYKCTPIRVGNLVALQDLNSFFRLFFLQHIQWCALENE